MTVPRFFWLVLAAIFSAALLGHLAARHAHAGPIIDREVISIPAKSAEAYNAWTAAVIQDAPNLGACRRADRVTRYEGRELLTRWIEAAQRMNLAPGGDCDTTRLAEVADELYRGGRAGKIGRAFRCGRFNLKIWGA